MRSIFLSLFLIMFSLSIQADEVSTIHVSAEGTVKTQPDAAIINLSIQSSETEAESAMNMVDKQAKKLIKQIKGYAIKEGSFDSSQTSIQPEYDYQAKPRKLVGYRANRSISFQLTNLVQLESVINDISKSELTNINNVAFTVQDMQKFEDIALVNAINTAKQKARTIAKELDVDIKGIYKVNHHVRNAPPTYARALSAEMDMAKKSSYEQKDIDINTNIEIEFEIK